MRKRKAPKKPRSDELPTNPEFQRFAAFAGAIMQVPKSEVDRLLAEEREAKDVADETKDESLVVMSPNRSEITQERG
jgi:hypothetical protein